MQQLQELTSVIERLSMADSFEAAAEQLTQWSRGITGCREAIVRLRARGEEQEWLAACSVAGASGAFARDESLISLSECLCGRVTAGTTNADLPFFTPGGSFCWGRMSTFAEKFSAEQTGSFRGRCVAEGYESVAIFPLKSRGRVMGSLHLADPRPDVFGEGVAPMVESVCRLAGDVLLRHREDEQERSLLDKIQCALLPMNPPPVAGLSIGVSFDSATEMARLGGDFYDVIDLGQGRVLVLVGDVCGKGLEAAGIATQTRFALQALAGGTPNPGEFLQAANRVLLARLPSGRFVTAVACLIEPETGLISISSAGHPSPLRFEDSHGSEIDAPHNPPLGLFPEASFPEASERLSSGDLLVIYTDGVSDSRCSDGEFGIDGISSVVGGVPDRDPERIASDVCTAAIDYHDSSLPADDRLVVAVRLN